VEINQFDLNFGKFRTESFGKSWINLQCFSIGCCCFLEGVFRRICG
jgi:hypothetical protein